MRLADKYTYNFRQLILGKSFLNIADSFYAVALTVALVKVYNIEAGSLSIFTLVSMLPAMVGFLFGHLIDRIVDKKKWLVILQSVYLVLVTVIILCLLSHWPLVILFFINFLFYLVSTVIGALDTSVVPQALDDNEDLIEKSVDIQYLTSNILNITANFLASVLLGLVSYFVVLNISIPFFIAGIFFFWSMHITPREMHIQEIDTNPSREGAHAAGTDRLHGYLQDVRASLSYFAQQKVSSSIILIEAFLSGALDVLIALMPLYLISIHVNVKWLGFVLAVQQGSDLLGSLLAPFIKIKPTHFFCWDYMISGTALLLVFLVPSVGAKLALFALGFVTIGISGNYFSKMLFGSYEHSRLGSVDTIIRALYAIFGIIFLIVPLFYSNVYVLGIVFNALTIAFGIGLALIIYGSAFFRRRAIEGNAVSKS